MKTFLKPKSSLVIIVSLVISLIFIPCAFGESFFSQSATVDLSLYDFTHFNIEPFAQQNSGYHFQATADGGKSFFIMPDENNFLNAFHFAGQSLYYVLPGIFVDQGAYGLEMPCLIFAFIGNDYPPITQVVIQTPGWMYVMPVNPMPQSRLFASGATFYLGNQGLAMVEDILAAAPQEVSVSLQTHKGDYTFALSQGFVNYLGQVHSAFLAASTRPKGDLATVDRLFPISQMAIVPISN